MDSTHSERAAAVTALVCARSATHTDSMVLGEGLRPLHRPAGPPQVQRSRVHVLGASVRRKAIEFSDIEHSSAQIDPRAQEIARPPRGASAGSGCICACTPDC